MSTARLRQFLIASLVLLAACGSSGQDEPGLPPPLEGGFHAPEPVPLSPETVEDFIDFAGASTRDQLEDVRAQIDAARGNEAVARAMFDALARVWWLEGTENRTADFGRVLVIFQIIKHLAPGSWAAELHGYVTRPLPPQTEAPDGLFSERDGIEMLESDAVDALVCIRTKEAEALVQSVLADHPSKSVRDEAARQLANQWCKFGQPLDP
jgi:hypothetical protein